MTKKEFDQKWGKVDVDTLSDAEFVQFKQDCFEMYEQTGFIDRFDSPYDDEGEHNGMKFEVIRRARERDEYGNLEVDLEAMPVWLIEFENGDTAYCYPEEICKVEHQG